MKHIKVFTTVFVDSRTYVAQEDFVCDDEMADKLIRKGVAALFVPVPQVERATPGNVEVEKAQLDLEPKKALKVKRARTKKVD